jgi:hypothetical protein
MNLGFTLSAKAKYTDLIGPCKKQPLMVSFGLWLLLMNTLITMYKVYCLMFTHLILLKLSKVFKLKSENQQNLIIKTLRMDDAGENTSTFFFLQTFLQHLLKASTWNYFIRAVFSTKTALPNTFH